MRRGADGGRTGRVTAAVQGGGAAGAGADPLPVIPLGNPLAWPSRTPAVATGIRGGSIRRDLERRPCCLEGSITRGADGSNGWRAVTYLERASQLDGDWTSAPAPLVAGVRIEVET